MNCLHKLADVIFGIIQKLILHHQTWSTNKGIFLNMLH